MNALMTNIKSRYIKEKTVKLTMKYFNEYEKAVKLMQQTILQKKTNSLKNENNRKLHSYRF